MIVLGIESSCDETAAALLRDGREILSSVVSSQIAVHVPFGGVVPELASREHVDNISFVVQECFRQAGQSGAEVTWKDIGAVAVTRGPGLIGALMVGLTYAKSTAFALGVPFLGVNHLEGHIASIFLDHPAAELPALSLVVSGGHTSLYHLLQRHTRAELARTRDDAAGEALDKLAKFLGLGYPGGPVIEKLARSGDSGTVRFPLPRFTDGSLDFSFSGIKTSAIRYAKEHRLDPTSRAQDVTPGVAESRDLPQPVLDLVASYQKSIIDQLLHRSEAALQRHEVRSVHVSGGVSCNGELRRRASEFFGRIGLPVYFPRPALTTDNAAMIAAAAYLRAEAGESDPWDLPADPSLRVTG